MYVRGCAHYYIIIPNTFFNFNNMPTDTDSNTHGDGGSGTSGTGKRSSAAIQTDIDELTEMEIKGGEIDGTLCGKLLEEYCVGEREERYAAADAAAS